MKKKYGSEWEKEVMKNSKKVIVEILRHVSTERDKPEWEFFDYAANLARGIIPHYENLITF